jgi:hypothetical protein
MVRVSKLRAMVLETVALLVGFALRALEPRAISAQC